jgi:DNA repair protein RadC
MNMSTRIRSETPIAHPKDAYVIFKRIARKPQEYFTVLTLSGAHEPIKLHIVTIGTLGKTLVHPREVFRPALFDNAAAVMVAHNHPSGQLTPAEEDKAVTRELKAAAEILGIRLLDHLIVSKKGYFSFVQSRT